MQYTECATCNRLFRANAHMDAELKRLLRGVESGTIQSPIQVRQILAAAKTAIEHSRNRVSKAERLLWAAERAFLDGWTSAPSSHC